jgi:hypothetical protein
VLRIEGIREAVFEAHAFEVEARPHQVELVAERNSRFSAIAERRPQQPRQPRNHLLCLRRVLTDQRALLRLLNRKWGVNCSFSVASLASRDWTASWSCSRSTPP